ncbi:hypothetical protein CcCBS67573_g01041 [Chytriomyces confervae]|uniref:Uncharacterized protein n=1 Tax=Chytriomyces confervae TaxID=246404 RepID=A0A507FS12_9FUNG|nr:hypothetical protein CcCBS67573_g01041 [Chytriomyces confervae]
MPLPRQQFLALNYPNPLPDIAPGGISPHPARPFSFPLEIYPFLVAILCWYTFSLPRHTKLVSLIIAILFAPIESIFYMVTSEDPVSGAVEVDWASLGQGKLARPPHTTLEQFFANLVFSGFLFVGYYRLFEGMRRGKKAVRGSAKQSGKQAKRGAAAAAADGIFHVSMPATWDAWQWLRVLMFPLLVWGLEVVEGFVLIGMYGWNPAWIYSGDNAYLLGTIHLGHGKFWLLLGGLMEAGLWSVIERV